MKENIRFLKAIKTLSVLFGAAAGIGIFILVAHLDKVSVEVNRGHVFIGVVLSVVLIGAYKLKKLIDCEIDWIQREKGKKSIDKVKKKY